MGGKIFEILLKILNTLPDGAARESEGCGRFEAHLDAVVARDSNVLESAAVFREIRAAERARELRQWVVGQSRGSNEPGRPKIGAKKFRLITASYSALICAPAASARRRLHAFAGYTRVSANPSPGGGGGGGEWYLLGGGRRRRPAAAVKAGGATELARNCGPSPESTFCGGVSRAPVCQPLGFRKEKMRKITCVDYRLCGQFANARVLSPRPI